MSNDALNIISKLSLQMDTQYQAMLEKQTALEKEVQALRKQNEKLLLNVIAMSPMYQEAERKEALLKLSQMKAEEEKTEDLEAVIK